MKFTKHLTSILISFTSFFCTNPAFSEPNIASIRLYRQIICKISSKKTIYINAEKPVKIDGVEDQLYFYYSAGKKTLDPFNTKNNTKNSPLLPYLFHEIKMIEIKNSSLLAIPNIDNRKIYHFVTVHLTNGKTLDRYLKVKPGKGYYHTPKSSLLKPFNLADCKTIIFEGFEEIYD